MISQNTKEKLKCSQLIQNRSDVVAQLLGANKLRSFYMVHKRNVKRKRKKDDEEEALCAVCLNYRVKKNLTFFFLSYK